MKSTYRVLFYLKKNAIQKNGKSIIMIRITINGEIAQLTLFAANQTKNHAVQLIASLRVPICVLQIFSF